MSNIRGLEEGGGYLAAIVHWTRIQVPSWHASSRMTVMNREITSMIQ